MKINWNFDLGCARKTSSINFILTRDESRCVTVTDQHNTSILLLRHTYEKKSKQ